MLEKIGLFALHQMDPERAHGWAIRALKSGWVPGPKIGPSARLATTVAGLTMASPLGIAAGFDKNAEVTGQLARAGFGWIEAGAATPRSQPGNPKPRLFRLSEDRAVINRFGFNNDGMHQIAERLSQYQGHAPLGLNLGANKDSDDRAKDYVTVLKHCGAHLDFATVNISSPNTERLRDLQGSDALKALLDGVMTARAGLDRAIPIFLKIAPDLTDQELEDIAVVATHAGIDAIIATNTTLDRQGLRSPHAGQTGGLSGAPLFDPSTRVLARLSSLTALPLIGVGGIGSAEQAYAKIRAGAQAIQVYSALVYRGMGLIDEIHAGLDRLLAQDGYDSVAQAVGTDRVRWLT